MNNLELISLYENVATITANMLDAARTGDWELLAQLETNCSNHVQSIRDSELPIELPAEMRDRKIRIIKKILADDKEIRDITEPWMLELSNLMKNSSTARKLSQAYGTSHAA